MCVIIYKPKGAVIPPLSHFSNALLTNSDGWGMAVLDPKKPTVPTKKVGTSFGFKYEDLKRDLHEYVSTESTLVFHARIGTSGANGVQNLHPFLIPKTSIWLAHNGILPSYAHKGSPYCDTRHFANALGKRFRKVKWAKYGTPSDIIRDDGWKAVLENHIGAYNKMVLMDEDGAVILNEKEGFWDDETKCWYSNESAHDLHYYTSVYAMAYEDDNAWGSYADTRWKNRDSWKTNKETVKNYGEKNWIIDKAEEYSWKDRDELAKLCEEMPWTTGAVLNFLLDRYYGDDRLTAYVEPAAEEAQSQDTAKSSPQAKTEVKSAKESAAIFTSSGTPSLGEYAKQNPKKVIYLPGKIGGPAHKPNQPVKLYEYTSSRDGKPVSYTAWQNSDGTIFYSTKDLEAIGDGQNA